MKTLVQKITVHTRYSKFYNWGKLITITGSTQLFVQATALIGGIIIIRLLPIKEYAFYTLANTMLGTMTMLADSGITNGVMAQGGKVWENFDNLGKVIATGLKLRKKFGLVTFLLVAPVLIYLLISQGAAIWTSTLIVLSIIPAFYAALSDSFLEVAPKLHQDIHALQRNQAEVSIGRLVLTASLIFFWPFTFIALFANSIPRIYGNLKLKKISAKFANQASIADTAVEREIMHSVKRTLPIVIYHAISGQLSVWLVSFFGSVNSISQIGALGRIAVLFNVLSIMFATLIVPRFSRMNCSKGKLLKTFLLIQLVAVGICILFLLVVFFFSNQILWVFGKNYYGLDYELLLFSISSCVGLVANLCSQLTISRGWFFNPYMLIAVNFTSTLICIAFLHISSLKSVLFFNITVATVTYILFLLYGIFSIRKAY